MLDYKVLIFQFTPYMSILLITIKMKKNSSYIHLPFIHIF